MLLRLFVFAVLMLDGWSRLNPEPREFAVLELNHRFDEFGTHCFDQIIVWEWVRRIGGMMLSAGGWSILLLAWIDYQQSEAASGR